MDGLPATDSLYTRAAAAAAKARETREQRSESRVAKGAACADSLHPIGCVAPEPESPCLVSRLPGYKALLEPRSRHSILCLSRQPETVVSSSSEDAAPTVGKSRQEGRKGAEGCASV